MKIENKNRIIKKKHKKYHLKHFKKDEEKKLYKR